MNLNKKRFNKELKRRKKKKKLLRVRDEMYCMLKKLKVKKEELG